MDRTQKAEFIDSVRESFQRAPYVVLTDFKGSSVAQMDALRRSMEQAGATFQVVKKTLTKIAIADGDHAGLSEFFSGNVGVMFAGEDPIAAAKAFRAQVKENDKLQVKAGFFEGDVLDPKQAMAVADLPSREELLAKFLQTLQEGPRQVLGVIQGPARDLLSLLNNYAAKLEENG